MLILSSLIIGGGGGGGGPIVKKIQCQHLCPLHTVLQKVHWSLEVFLHGACTYVDVKTLERIDMHIKKKYDNNKEELF